jgi:hypothetical protein
MPDPASPRTSNAVIVVPGIMGSELVDSDGDVVWGLKPSLFAKAWVTGALSRLRPTPEELEGRPRLRATRLIRDAGWLPILRGQEPYTAIVGRLRKVAARPEAVAEFPYDWRLPVAAAAEGLCSFADRHLGTWRETVRREGLGDPGEAKLVIVAHSMGGVVARHAGRVLGLDAEIADVITAGTPYFGSVKAVEAMAQGRVGVPLPRAAVAGLACACPGLYDLLPRYRCVVDGGALRQLTVDDVVDVGGDRELARQAADRWECLGLREADAPGSVWSSSFALIGAEQPTVQSLAIDAGQCAFIPSLGDVDHRGDSTVYADSAHPKGVARVGIPQKHSALLKDGHAQTMVADRLVAKATGVALGTRPLGVDIPDLVAAGVRPRVSVTGVGGDTGAVTVTSTNLATSAVELRWRGRRAGEDVWFEGPGLAPGLHRVEVKGGGHSPVSDIMMVEEA